MAPPKTVILNTFYEQLITFLGELKDMYPDDPDFPLGLTSVRMIKAVNPMMIIQTFYDGAKAFESEILSQNEQFFLDHSFEDVEDLDFNLLAKLKQYVKGMSEQSKKNVWVFVQNLYKLSKLAVR
jgi:hypothetical protein